MQKKIPPDLNIKREAIVLKGYASVADIAVFGNVSHPKAKDFYEIMKKQASSENKKLLERMVPIQRVLKFFNLTEDKVFKYAEIERRLIDEKEKDTLPSTKQTSV